jgi:hypothetical protein
MDDDDEDVPLSTLKSNGSKKRSSAGTQLSYRELSEDDEDDDVPLISLVAKGGTKRKRESTNEAKPQNKSKEAVTKKAAKSKSSSKKNAPSSSKKKKPSVTTGKGGSPKKKPPAKSSSTLSNTSSSKTYEWVSAALYGSNCDKGLLIQRLLCRWWYAYTWPDLEHPILPVPDTLLYDRLDGFPGVYIGTKGEVVGQIYDTRDLSTAPTFTNFVRKPATELQELLIRAIDEQKRQLVATEEKNDDSGKINGATVKDLDSMLKWARKVNPTKADKDAITVLKAYGLKMP